MTIPNFHEVRLPEHIESGAKGGPEFNTTVIEMASGREQRNKVWALPRASWDISYGIMTQDDYLAVLSFFYARNGRAYGFKFKDWSDYSATDQEIGTANGILVDFQLIKIYDDSILPFSRKITRPLTGTVVIYDNDSVVSASDYDVSYTTGIIHFHSAPIDTHLITADYEYDVPVRFDSDSMAVTLDWVDAGTIDSIVIRQLKE